MTHVLRRGVAVAVVSGLLLLTGCADLVNGIASPGSGVPRDVTQDELPIAGAVEGNEVDDTARDTFGGDFEPLQGTINSVDPDDYDPSDYPEGTTCGLDVDEVADNAYYCGEGDYPNTDGVTYDRSFMAELAGEYGRYLPSLVMAHEYGHAIQARYPTSPQESINAETQSDCFAGSFSRWVVDGNAAHSSLLTPELDQALQGFFLIRDPVGTDPNVQGAHGSFFDRVSGFQEGFDGGAAACRDNFEDGQRVFTQQPFTSDVDLQNEGNLPYGEAVSFTTETLDVFWTAAFDQVFGGDFRVPTVSPFSGTGPDCAGLDEDHDVGYCPDDEAVYVDETDLAEPAYEIGDFAVATALSLGYAEAARAQLDLPDADAQEVTSSTVCLTGWYSAQLFNGSQAPNATLSPGDLDEAISFLLTYGTQTSVFPDSRLSGFELIDTFRNGFFSGVQACDVGA